MKKIAFLFLIYDEILQEELWYNFFKNVDPNKYSIYIHYKNNKPLKFFEKFKLKQCIETNYGDISLVYAQKLLLDEALKDENNYKFINISQSCIPLKSFNYIYESLIYNNFTIFNESPRHQSFPRCDDLLKFLPKEQIYKSSQWWILNRKYAELISIDKEYINYFNNIYAPEEHYFISFIKNKGSIKDLVCTPNLAEGATTFTNWHDMIYPKEYLSKNNLKTYENISKKEIDHLIESPCFFGRKFTASCNVDGIALKDYLTISLNFLPISIKKPNNIDFYCIHPKGLNQRDGYVEALKNDIESIGYNFNIFNGVLKSSIFIDKDILQNEIINFEFNNKKEKIIFDNQRNKTEFDRKLSQGEIACMLSHFLLWQKLKNSNKEGYFILEDDANILSSKEEFKILIENIPDLNSFDICYFSNRQQHKIKNKINEWYYELDNGRIGHLWDQMFNGAEGYLLTKNGLEKLLKNFTLYCNADGFLHRWINKNQPKVITSYIKPISIIENIPSMIWS
jgi:GR25 family glycosyltransferase involved in LPS biosynthesis